MNNDSIAFHINDLRDIAANRGLGVCDLAADEIEDLEKAYALLFAENAKLRAASDAAKQQDSGSVYLVSPVPSGDLQTALGIALLADLIPQTVTVLEIAGGRSKVCMTLTELQQFMKAVMALPPVQPTGVDRP